MNGNIIEFPKSQSARKSQGRCLSRPIPTPAEHQVGRARTWLLKFAGEVALLIGWILAIVPVVAQASEPAWPLVVCPFMGAAFAFGFGLAWIVGVKKGGRR